MIRLRQAIVAGVAEVDLREKSPDRDREIAHKRLLDMGEPSHQPGCKTPRNAVGQEEVHILLLRQSVDDGAHCHGSVNLDG
jgi:hypothetical protein